MIILDFYDTLKMRLIVEKRGELMKKIKKPAFFADRVEEEIDLNKINESSDAFITDYSMAKDGSLRTYCLNHPEPMRFFIDQDTVILTAVYKRFIPLIAKSLAKQNWFKRIITILAIRFNFNVLPEWFDYIFSLKSVLINEDNYSQPVKEIRRVLRDKINGYILNAITLILESDSAYRYLVQDVLPLLDKSKLTNIFSTAKELNRLFKILIEREYNSEEKRTRYGNIKKFLIFGMILFPKLKKTIIDTLKEINLEEIKFSKEDEYWVRQFGVYNFWGKTWDERKQENIKLYNL